MLLRYRGAETFIAEARKWETSGDHVKAVECYLKVTPNIASNQELLEKCWTKVCKCTQFLSLSALHHIR